MMIMNLIQYKPYFEGFSHFLKYTLKLYRIFCHRKIKEKLVIKISDRKEKKKIERIG